MKIWVKAKDGCICPVPGQEKTACAGKAIEIEKTVAVRRLIRDGSLVLAEETGKGKKIAEPKDGNRS